MSRSFLGFFATIWGAVRGISRVLSGADSRTCLSPPQLQPLACACRAQAPAGPWGSHVPVGLTVTTGNIVMTGPLSRPPRFLGHADGLRSAAAGRAALGPTPANSRIAHRFGNRAGGSGNAGQTGKQSGWTTHEQTKALRRVGREVTPGPRSHPGTGDFRRLPGRRLAASITRHAVDSPDSVSRPTGVARVDDRHA